MPRRWRRAARRGRGRHGRRRALRGARREVAPYVAGSSAWSRALFQDGDALRGPTGSTAVLGLRGADGAVREVRVPRSDARTPPPGPAFHVLPEGFGYADLTRQETGEVDAMFEAFTAAPGIVFDMRGYPRGTAWMIAPRLARHDGAPAALFQHPLL